MDKKKPGAGHVIAAILLFLMAIIAFANVLSRYLFHFSFAATEEITINLFVWMTVVGSAIAFERGAQLGMTTLYRAFPARVKKWAALFSAVASAFLFIIVDIYTIEAIYDEIVMFKATSPALGIPVWIYYAGVPVLSLFVFVGIYKSARLQLTQIESESR
ncbi:MAG: TRAP transporter small permease [Deltaproteobacteria bacterium]|nr:TRAP transporter small permease [Deltaproteobacteria bacterium]